MTRRSFVAAIFLASAGFLAACASGVQFQSSSLGKPTRVHALMYRPDGPGPFPAVVLMHHAGGLYNRRGQVRRIYTDWAGKLKDWGYVALIVDSYGSRGVEHLFDIGHWKDRAYQVADAFGALRYLHGQPFVDGERIAVMGFSRGGFAVLNVLEDGGAAMYHDHPLPFRAGVAFYPICREHMYRKFTAPLLVLVGEKDDATPADTCARTVEDARALDSQAAIIVYPGAHHSFDDPEKIPLRYYARQGYHMGYQRKAHKASIEDVRQFLATHLKRAVGS
ncbi:MAG: dienelactone hydrolase family protein [Kiloniellaceae bacterium]